MTNENGWQTVICEGCHASRVLHELMNANAPSVNECPYCKRPRLTPEQLARLNNQIADSNYSTPYSEAWWAGW